MSELPEDLSAPSVVNMSNAPEWQEVPADVQEKANKLQSLIAADIAQQKFLLAAIRAEAHRAGMLAGLKEAAPVIAELAGVVHQMLDDMGAHSGYICETAKAAARAALGRVASPDLEIDYTMAQAAACFNEIGGEPQMALCAEELAEPWAAAIRARIAEIEGGLE
ncbi:hypothetical protein V5F34_00760 [Xanthobacter autotrophicus]|uniref:hypothetical protein n=1 Tax=Xanthobacter autotrophicus TaxID=280 RepID=UPI00372A46D9